MGAKKIAHGLRACIEEHWMKENITVLKVNMKSAFKLVSHLRVCQALS